MVFQKLFSKEINSFFTLIHLTLENQLRAKWSEVVRILFSFAFFIPSLCFLSTNLSFVRLSTLATYLKSTYLHFYCFLFFSFKIFFFCLLVSCLLICLFFCVKVFSICFVCSLSQRNVTIYFILTLLLYFSYVIVKVRITTYFCDNIENVCLNLFADDRLEGSDNKTLEWRWISD